MAKLSLFDDSDCLAIVGGPYKSGTSMLCERVESLGFANPGILTNQFEYGHGIEAGLYATRECSDARRINRQLAGCHPKQEAGIERRIKGYLTDMFAEMGGRLVIKDPYMKLTATHWFTVAREMGVPHLVFLMTTRDPEATLKSWANSRFLTRQKRSNPVAFQRLLSPLTPDSYERLNTIGVAMHIEQYEFRKILAER